MRLRVHSLRSRQGRLLWAALAPTLVLGLAAPASAAELPVEVVNFKFEPRSERIDVGDTVVWNFAEGDHSTTSEAGQAESWDSKIRAQGAAPFRHVFTRPGRYRYVCTPHENFPMKGVIQVGQDRVAKTVKRVRTRTRGGTATVSFTLNEPARVSYAVKGPTKRTLKSRRLKKGKRSLKVKRLSAGRYTGTLRLTDDFGKTVKPKSRFSIR